MGGERGFGEWVGLLVCHCLLDPVEMLVVTTRAWMDQTCGGS